MFILISGGQRRWANRQQRSSRPWPSPRVPATYSPRLTTGFPPLSTGSSPCWRRWAIGLDFFIASFAIGVGGTGWTLQGEVFPTAVRGQAAAFAAMIDWLANFALIEAFPVTQNAISLSGVLVVFAGLAALAIVFIWKFLPETKNLSVEEIIGLFEHQQTTLPKAS